MVVGSGGPAEALQLWCAAVCCGASPCSSSSPSAGERSGLHVCTCKLDKGYHLHHCVSTMLLRCSSVLVDKTLLPTPPVPCLVCHRSALSEPAPIFSSRTCPCLGLYHWVVLISWAAHPVPPKCQLLSGVRRHPFRLTRWRTLQVHWTLQLA